MNARFRSIPVIIGLLCTSAPAVRAQSLVNASATVPTASPTGGGVRNLAFGAITPIAGMTQTVVVPAAIAPQSATAYAGEFSLGVDGASGVDFTIGAPAVLTSAAGGMTLPISFSGTQYGAFCVVEGGSGCTTASFDPAAAGLQKVCQDYRGNGNCMTNRVWQTGTQLRVFVGGAVSVAPGAMAATYSGVITMTIVQVY